MSDVYVALLRGINVGGKNAVPMRERVGVARSKLTNAYVDGKLGTVSTARNWRTVERLVALSSARIA